MDFQANVLPQQRMSNPKRGKKGAERNQQVDIRKMREEYAIEDGADFDLKLPNNTFNKLFSPPEDEQSMKMLKNFSFANKDASYRNGKP